MTWQPVKPEAMARELIMGYGAPGSGKTRLFTSLTERFGKIAYLPFDLGAGALKSVLPHYKERIDVWPVEDWDDPLTEAWQIPFKDWKTDGYDTLILDTFTALVKAWFDQGVRRNKWQANHRHIGKPGTNDYVALGDRSDYMGTQSVVRNFVNSLLKKNPLLNIIMICHQSLDKDEDGNGTVIGGPESVGRKMIEELPSKFDTVIRMNRQPPKQIIVNNKPVKVTRLVAEMSQHGVWIARRNEASVDGNPLPSLELETDPINFWRKYDETSPILQGVSK